jgi:hypothetical protein
MRAGIPPRVTSKKTIGFSSVASAMFVAVQNLLPLCCLFAGADDVADCTMCATAKLLRSGIPMVADAK